MNASHDSHPLGSRLKERIPKKAADKLRRPIVRDIQPNQAITTMHPIAPIEVLIQGEERRSRQAVQRWYQVLIGGSPRCHVHANHAETDPPFTQRVPLVGGYVFVEH